MHLDWLRSHVQLLLQDIWSDARVRRDGDGDFPFRAGSASCWVRVEPEADIVSVFGIAVSGLPQTKRLLRELNEINANSRLAHVYWESDCVFVEYSLPVHILDGRTLAAACAAVGGKAARTGPLIAAVFGGRTPCPASADLSEEAQPE